MSLFDLGVGLNDLVDVLLDHFNARLEYSVATLSHESEIISRLEQKLPVVQVFLDKARQSVVYIHN